MNFQKDKADLETTEMFNDIHNNPVIKNLCSVLGCAFGIFPLADIIPDAVSKLLNDDLKRKQQRVITDLLMSKSITEYDVEDIGFVTEFAKLLEAVKRTNGNTKIKYMTDIFKGTVCNGEKEYDSYEEYLQRIYDMSEREIRILLIMNRCEQKEENMNYRNDTREQKLGRIWHEEKITVKNELGIDEATLRSILIGLQRTGFCASEYLNYESSGTVVYILTRYFKDFMEFVTD